MERTSDLQSLSEILYLMNEERELIAKNKEGLRDIPAMFSDDNERLLTKNPDHIVERIKFAMRQCHEKKVTSHFAVDVPKTSYASKSFRCQGNDVFRSGSLDVMLQASALYNQSAALAPEGSLEMTLALSNKSALLLKVQKYKQCLQVIERCLTLDRISDDIKFKVLVRKVECQKVMKESEADKTYAEAIKLINKQPLKNQKSMKDLLTKAQATRGIYNDKEEWFDKMVHVLGHPSSNEEIPAASSSIKLQYNENKGRHFVAAKNIKPGEILIFEKPYCSRVRLGCYDYCYGCLNPAYNIFPCEHCVVAIYCSEECRKESWDKFHDVECQIISDLEVAFGRLEEIQAGGLAVRMTITAVREFKNLEKMKQEIKDVETNTDERMKGFTANGKFHSDKYRSVYSLYKGNLDPYNIPMLAAIFAHLLATRTTFFGQRYTSWEEIIKNSDILFVADLFAKNMKIAQTKTFGSRPDGQNRQLMTSMNFINHCCYPNVIVTHRGGSNVIIALQTIKIGEELLITYCTEKNMELVDHMSYIFGCPCHVCQRSWMSSPTEIPKFSRLELDKETKKLLNKEYESIQLLLKGFNEMRSTEDSFEHVIYVLQRLFDCIATFDKYIQSPTYEICQMRQFIAKVMKNMEGEMRVTI